MGKGRRHRGGRHRRCLRRRCLRRPYWLPLRPWDRCRSPSRMWSQRRRCSSVAPRMPGHGSRMMLACPRRVDRSEDRRNTADKSGCMRFPFNNFTCFLTLFPKCFSSFDHSTCALSVSGRYLALEGIYLPFRAAFPNNSTRRRSYVAGANRSHTGFSPSVTSCSKELRPAAAQKHPLQITTRACARFQI